MDMHGNIGVALSLGFGAAFLSACATDSLYNDYAIVDEPALNIVASSMVDEEMLSQRLLKRQKGIYFAKPQKISSYSFSSGFLPEKRDTDRYTIYSFNNTGSKKPTSDGYSNMSKLPGVEAAETLRVMKATGKVCVMGFYGEMRFCSDEVEFEKTEKMVVDDKAFQQFLYYRGKEGGKITVNYRELSGSSAVVKVDSNLEYDLSTSDEIAYKGALIKVLSADSKKIEYKVLRNFNDVKQ
jgi:hypothetical protein